MKFLLIVVVFALLVWHWRTRRSASKPPPQRKPDPATVDMRRCQHCGVHLPASETIAGRLGVYCSAEHRQRAEP
ncbi:MAG: hypothetical protein K9J77_07325 [Rhodoferax sp.]|nr:hypothetical protein [Rhodoferax sp.]